MECTCSKEATQIVIPRSGKRIENSDTKTPRNNRRLSGIRSTKVMYESSSQKHEDTEQGKETRADGGSNPAMNRGRIPLSILLNCMAERMADGKLATVTRPGLITYHRLNPM